MSLGQNCSTVGSHAQFSTPSHHLRSISREWEGGVGMITWMARNALASDVLLVLAAKLKRHGGVPCLYPWPSFWKWPQSLGQVKGNGNGPHSSAIPPNFLSFSNSVSGEWFDSCLIPSTALIWTEFFWTYTFSWRSSPKRNWSSAKVNFP